MEPRLHSAMDMLLVIGRDGASPRKPKHYITTFDHNEVEMDSSKLYVHNAMWNKEDSSTGPTL